MFIVLRLLFSVTLFSYCWLKNNHWKGHKAVHVLIKFHGNKTNLLAQWPILDSMLCRIFKCWSMVILKCSRNFAIISHLSWKKVRSLNSEHWARYQHYNKKVKLIALINRKRLGEKRENLKNPQFFLCLATCSRLSVNSTNILSQSQKQQLFG